MEIDGQGNYAVSRALEERSIVFIGNSESFNFHCRLRTKSIERSYESLPLQTLDSGDSELSQSMRKNDAAWSLMER